MEYTTVFTTLQQNQVVIIRHLFKEHGLDFRILDQPVDNAIPAGVRVQVVHTQVGKAKEVLKENGFFGTPEPKPEGKIMRRFWLYLVLGLFLLIIISILLNWYINSGN